MTPDATYRLSTYRLHRGVVVCVPSPNRRPTFLHERLADFVKARRAELGLSQEELADRCGLHRTYVGAIERAGRNPSIATLEALAEGLGVDPAELLRE